ncbi:MAG: hypothetical protein J6W00_02920 [Lentisphaeria bacterium]|nr:hypothetical protein [Lentisphaeria bacterium]
MKNLSILIAVFLTSVAAMAEIVVKNGDKIAFLGDSITYFGDRSNGGYVNLVIAGLEANGIKALKAPAGISGNKSKQMLERLEKDILRKKPQFMTLSCGVNDVWHGKAGIKLPEYKKNITELVSKAQASGITVMILTATMITENPDSAYNKALAPYNDFLRQLAAEKKCLFADLNGDMQKTIAGFKVKYPNFKGTLCTYDGVHMNQYGNEVMALGILRAFGMNDSEIAKAKNSWQNRVSTIGQVQLTTEMIIKLAPLAAEKGVSIQEYIIQMINDLPAK